MAEQSFPPYNDRPGLPENPTGGENKKEALALGARLLFIVVGIVGVGGLAWGAYRFNANIKAPFLFNGNANSNANTTADLIALQGKDSDEDGLSDYDELYAYKTSPYLKDTDSDGFDDKQELESGHDPNCPAGQNCGLADVNANTNTEVELPDTSGINQVLSGNLTAAQIREILLQNGVSQAELDQIDDATLLQLYRDAMAEQNANTNSSITNSQALTDSEKEQLKKMTPSEVRAFMLQQGADQAELDKIDDTTLMQSWQQILAEEGIT